MVHCKHLITRGKKEQIHICKDLNIIYKHLTQSQQHYLKSLCKNSYDHSEMFEKAW